MPVEFLEKLIGNVTGLYDLETYLTHLGYLDHKNCCSNASPHDDVFDDRLELAIKSYQVFYNLNATGVLDVDTVTIMSLPCCGVPDFFQTNETQNHFPYHYTFFPGEPKWPPSRRILTYSLPPRTRKDALDPVAHALSKWASVSNFKFTHTEYYEKADIRLSFQHIDGPWRLLAYAYAPPSGKVNSDVDEEWSANVVPGEFDIETVGLHELGRTLGLGHSNVPGSIMFPTIGSGIRKGLSSDDIDGIKTLYNL